MTLRRFYPLLSGHAQITIKARGKVLYKGTVSSTPDECDELTVLDFYEDGEGYTFIVR